jgi:hypothetical protein
MNHSTPLGIPPRESLLGTVGISHGIRGDDIGDRLLGQMAKQVRLSKKEFIELVDCPMSKEGYAQKVKDLSA